MINYKKHLSKMIHIPKTKIRINIFYMALFGIILIIITIVILLTIILSGITQKKQEAKAGELLAEVRKTGVEEMPFQFSFNEELAAGKNDHFAGLIQYINRLLGDFYSILTSKKAEQDKIKKIISPAIYDSNIKQKRLKVLIKPDEMDLKQFLCGFYSKNSEIKSIPGYSTGIFHFHKEKDSDVIFNYLDGPAAKGFFMGKMAGADDNKKILFLGLLNYMLYYSDKNISSTKGYITNLNSAIYSIGRSDLSMHAGYMILNTDSNYVEIASTGFSPLIHYNAKTDETTYYKFNSILAGEKPNDKFLKELKKESFQLSPGDIILLPDPGIEELTNTVNEKFEIYRIADIINEFKTASADVIADKIKGAISRFSIDLSGSEDLFILLIKRDKNNE